MKRASSWTLAYMRPGVMGSNATLHTEVDGRLELRSCHDLPPSSERAMPVPHPAMAMRPGTAGSKAMSERLHPRLRLPTPSKVAAQSVEAKRPPPWVAASQKHGT